MERFVAALAIGFAVVSTVWYVWTWAYVDPDPYVGLWLVIGYQYLAPLFLAMVGFVACLVWDRRPEGGELAEHAPLWLRRGGPVFLGLLIGGSFGSYAVSSGGT
jgi:hypothetical protein